MSKATNAVISERSRQAEAYRRLDSLTIWWIGVLGFFLVGGIVWTSCVNGKQIDAGLTALAGSAVTYLGNRFTNRNRQDLPPGTATVTPPAAIVASSPRRRRSALATTAQPAATTKAKGKP